MTPLVRRRVRVRGIVQGVGYRPFVYGLAVELGLRGFVGNDAAGVVIEIEGAVEACEKLVAALGERAPALAQVTEVTAEDILPGTDTAFVIAASTAGRADTLISPDSATCADCLRELRDPADRRHRHPFVTCTNCGPRYTIVTGVPYDRAATTMAGFPMCPACAAEYHDPGDRRFHAQPVCCPDCGPTLRLLDATGGVLAAGRGGPAVIAGSGREAVVGAVARPEAMITARPGARPTPDGPPDPIAAAAGLLRGGAVLAVKGLGGYHLAAMAADEAAVAALRARKHREDKPFAVLVRDVAAARALAELDPAEEALLASRRAPIVLLRRRPGAAVAPSVAPGNAHLGVLLAYTPVHHLLLDALGGAPIVLTSGNVSDEPIAHLDGDARERLRGIAEAFLTHDRPIHTRTDDSVLRVVEGRVLPVRRSRGYAPEPVRLAQVPSATVLGCGAELKNTFCVLRGNEAFLSHHVGDLENAETLRAYTDGVAHLQRLLDVAPRVLAHDLHPEYLSTKYALARADSEDVELVGVQHHHAHLAACLADNDEPGPVIGIACDGLGYGTDGTLWGGEVMEVSLAGFRRLAHLEPVPLPGGVTAIRQPWRTAASWLRAAGVDVAGLPVAATPGWPLVARLLDSGAPMPVTTSVGRLFDAVAAIAGVRATVHYEGQAAIELEQAADPAVTEPYPAAVDGPLIRGGDLVRAVAADVHAGVPTGVVAARFHHGLAAVLTVAATRAATAQRLDAVALSGGVFQNVALLGALTARLRGAGLRVLTHSRVSCNDGGISLGQVAVAAARRAP
ncbi:MAG: carbamoyltransferase HypF [Pseudonocardia sp.]